MEKHSILLVDDEEIVIESLKQILKSEYALTTAMDGKSAIEAAEKVKPDIILLDIIMPGMDGYAVISALKKSKKTRDIPIIIITALNSYEDEEKGLALGATDYISKPFSPLIVRLRIRNQINMLTQLRTIERLSMIDPLTNLPNRRSFEIQLNSEWVRAQREQTPISILFIDADKFKNYNDNYGHQQGDIALQALAKTFAEILKRPADFSARWGGEEFVALLSNTDLKGAIEVAEQIRRNVEEMDIPYADGPVTKLTVSIGINTLEQVQSDMMIEEFISVADKALYEAKAKGRNRVCYFSA